MRKTSAGHYRQLVQEAEGVLLGIRRQLSQELLAGDRKRLEQAQAAQALLLARYAGQEAWHSARELADHTVPPESRAFKPQKARPMFGAVPRGIILDRVRNTR